MPDGTAWVPTQDTRNRLFADISEWLFYDKYDKCANWRHVFYLSNVIEAELAFRMKVNLPVHGATFTLDDTYFEDVIQPRIKALSLTSEASIMLLVELQVWLIQLMGQRILEIENIDVSQTAASPAPFGSYDP